jgi:hypothetical protein
MATCRLRKTLGRCLQVGSLVLLLAFNATGCSRKFVVMSLEDAIRDIASRTQAAACTGVVFRETSAELFVKTAYKLSAGAPAGSIPITLGGEAALEESSKVTVKLADPDVKKCPTPGAPQMFGARPGPTLYLYDPKTGAIEEFGTPRQEVK